MHDYRVRFVDSDHLHCEWEYYRDGKAAGKSQVRPCSSEVVNHTIRLNTRKEFFMANFLFVYRGGDDAYAKMTPDEMQQHMQKWSDWIGEAMAKGWMVDAGDALTEEGRVVDAQEGRDRRAVRGVQGDRRRLLDRQGRHDRRRRRARQGLPGLAHRRQGRSSAARRAGIQGRETACGRALHPTADNPCPRHSRNRSLLSWSIFSAARRGDWWPS